MKIRRGDPVESATEWYSILSQEWGDLVRDVKFDDERRDEEEGDSVVACEIGQKAKPKFNAL